MAATNTHYYRCTGRGAGQQELCLFSTADESEATAHYEDADHDLELVDVDAPCGYVLTDAGRAYLVAEAFDKAYWPAPEPFAGKTVDAWLP